MARDKDISATSAIADEAATFEPLPPIVADPVMTPAVSVPIAVAAPPPAAIEQTPTTAPRPQTPDGFVLDEWGLPLIGPARVAMLAGRTDPAIDPTGWATAPAGPQE